MSGQLVDMAAGQLIMASRPTDEERVVIGQALWCIRMAYFPRNFRHEGDEVYHYDTAGPSGDIRILGVMCPHGGVSYFVPVKVLNIKLINVSLTPTDDHEEAKAACNGD